jgi:predicted amidohydrolase YtcJ
VKEWIDAHPQDEAVLAVQYDDTKLREMRHPTREELDVISQNKVVVIQHISGI